MAASTTSAATTLDHASLLDIPRELRELILDEVFLGHRQTFSVPSRHTDDQPHYCILDILLCNKQIFHEARELLLCRPISFSTDPLDPSSSKILSSIPCLHGLDCSRVPYIRFELNPFQHITSIPMLWLSLLSICEHLRRGSAIRHLQIKFDGTVPRTRPPLYINEDDLDRGPLNIALLLHPFKLLHDVGQADIVVLGGPLNDPWSENIPLREFGAFLKKQLETPGGILTQDVVNIEPLRHEMERNRQSLWSLSSYQSIFADLVSCSTITVPPPSYSLS